MTLVELLIALTLLAIGISALVAGLSSGLVAIGRAAKASTAGAVADARMEGYRRGAFQDVPSTSPAPGFPTTVVGADGRTYGVRVDGSWVCPLGGTPADITRTGTTTNGGTKIIGLSATSDLSLGVAVTGPAGSGIATGSVITAIPSSSVVSLSLPETASASNVSLTFLRTCAGSVKNRAAKNVVVTIRDGAAGRVLLSETSTFDQATG